MKKKHARVQRIWTDPVQFVGVVYGGARTLKQISEATGIPYWNLQKRASKVAKKCAKLVIVIPGRPNQYLPTKDLSVHQARQAQKRITPRQFAR